MNPQPPPADADSSSTTPQGLREQYESGATVAELVAASRLSYGTVLNRLREADTVMRTSWQTRRLRDGPARRNLAARLRRLYEQQGATLTELAKAGSVTRYTARRLLIEAGGTPRTTQQTHRIRSAVNTARRKRLVASLRARYEAGATVPELAEECSYSVATVYRLLHQADTPMRPQHNHGAARTPMKRS
ncbi:helix-turn-helix domain-containing protein [Streptomyces sp. NPDC001858]